jgi:hypothetical protein
MKMAGRMSVMATALLLMSSGVVYPLKQSMTSAQIDVDVLESELAHDQGVHAQLLAAHARMLEVQQRIQSRPFSLCADTPEAEHEFETTLLELVQGSGLNSVKMDRQAENRTGRIPQLNIDLVVEGDAFALHKFLEALEGTRWVTRVLSIAIEPGNEVRRITLQVAVMLEQKP